MRFGRLNDCKTKAMFPSVLNIWEENIEHWFPV